MTPARIQEPVRAGAQGVARPGRRYHRLVRGPPITLTCECGDVAYVPYGERWTCPRCDRTWDTSKIPEADYARLVGSVRGYRALALGPPLAFAVVLVPLAIVFGLQYGLLLFVLVFAYAIFVLPKLRERASKAVGRSARSWELHPE
jgi:hypothetical protein